MEELLTAETPGDAGVAELKMGFRVAAPAATAAAAADGVAGTAAAEAQTVMAPPTVEVPKAPSPSPPASLKPFPGPLHNREESLGPQPPQTPTAARNATPSRSSSKSNKKRHTKPHKTGHRAMRRLFRDAIAFDCPLGVAANFGPAVRRTRERRLRALEAAFPRLAGGAKAPMGEEAKVVSKEASSHGNGGAGSASEAASPESAADSASPPSKKKTRIKPVGGIPRPSDFANMIDYLEAKYVQGVVLQDDLDRADGGGADPYDEDDDEGAGSVYSETSFLDDTDLQRTVAEQVLAHTTTTRVELMQDEDDAFFVNVGALEVEETELTSENYDPLKDTNTSKPRKRKRPAKSAKDVMSAAENNTNGENASKSTTSGSLKPKKKSSKASATGPGSPMANSTAGSKASLKSSATIKTTASAKLKSKSKDGSQKPSIKKIKSPEGTASTMKVAATQPIDLAAETAELKAKAMHLYDELVSMIQACTPEELPRRKVSERVAVTCPPDKKEGDVILFHNPHVPKQKLKVKVPKNTPPGGTFKVTVPIPVDDMLDDGNDYNKLSRQFYDTLDDYSRAYDEWCDMEAVLRKSRDDNDYQAHLEKRKKFDELMKVFPNNLKTPVDLEYMKKLLRRARQNRSKREQTLARKAGSPSTLVSVKDTASRSPITKKPKLSALTKPALKSTTPPASPTRQEPVASTIVLPALSSKVVSMPFSAQDFVAKGE